MQDKEPDFLTGEGWHARNPQPEPAYAPKKRRARRLTLAGAALLAVCLIVPQSRRAIASSLLAIAEYGVRFIPVAAPPSNCTSGRDCVYVSTSTGHLTHLTSAGATNDLDAPGPTNFGGVYNVQAYGAKGDGTTDDTTAIQNAINAWVGLSAGKLYFPPGTYKITSALTISQLVGGKISGSSRGSVTIKQATANTPIFNFTTCDSHSFIVEGITFTWASAQPSTNTSAVALFFSGTNGNVLDGYYNFTIRDVTFSNGFRGLANDTTKQISLWGWTLDNFRSDSTMSGGTVHAVPSPSVGQPNIHISNGYMRGDIATEPLVYISGAHPALFDHLEMEDGNVGSGAMPAVFQCSSCTNVVFHSVQVENVTLTTTGYRILITDNSQALYDGVAMEPVNISAGVTAYGIQSTTLHAMANVRGVTAGMGTVGSGAAFYVLSGSFDQVEQLQWDPSGTAGTALIDPSSQVTPQWAVGSAIASATTIAPISRITHVTGTTTIQTITAPTAFAQTNFGGCLTLVADAAWATNTAGNIATAFTATTNTPYTFCYDNGTSKWYVQSGGGGSGTQGGTTSATHVPYASGANTLADGDMTFTAASHTYSLPPAETIANASQGAAGTVGITLAPNIADGAGGTALLVNNKTTLSSGVKMVRFQNNGTDEFVIYGGGALATPNGIFDTTLNGGFGLTSSGSLVYGSIKPSGNNIIQNGGTGAYWGSTWSAAYYTMPQSITAAASTTINPASGSYVKLNLQSATNVTSLTVSAGTDGQELIVEVTQPAAGTAATVPTTWTNVNFPGGTFTNTATLGKHDEITMIYNGTTSHWNVRSVALNEAN